MERGPIIFLCATINRADFAGEIIRGIIICGFNVSKQRENSLTRLISFLFSIIALIVALYNIETANDLHIIEFFCATSKFNQSCKRIRVCSMGTLNIFFVYCNDLPVYI